MSYARFCKLYNRIDRVYQQLYRENCPHTANLMLIRWRHWAKRQK